MAAHSIILFEGDPARTQNLAALLQSASNQVHAAGSFADLRRQIAYHRAEVAVINVEQLSMTEVMQLSQEFPATCIVCHHRLADEEMWTEALNAGAADICNSADGHAILSAVLQSAGGARGAAA